MAVCACLILPGCFPGACSVARQAGQAISLGRLELSRDGGSIAWPDKPVVFVGVLIFSLSRFRFPISSLFYAAHWAPCTLGSLSLCFAPGGGEHVFEVDMLRRHIRRTQGHQCVPEAIAVAAGVGGGQRGAWAHGL